MWSDIIYTHFLLERDHSSTVLLDLFLINYKWMVQEVYLASFNFHFGN